MSHPAPATGPGTLPVPAHELADAARLEAAPESPGLLLRAGAEAFGTFVLVLLGVGAAVYTSLVGGDALATALAFGLGGAAAVVVVGSVSGGHINPAVTLGAAVAGRLRWLDVPVYWFAQVAGAVAGVSVLRAVVPAGLPAAINETSAAAVISRGANGFGEHSNLAIMSSGAVEVPLVGALLVETILTLVLVAVVLAVTVRPSRLAPLWVGTAIAVTLLVATPFTGGSVNPARSLGTALLAEPWALSQAWVFVVAPLVGGAVAGLATLLLAPPAHLVIDASDESGEQPDDEAELVEVDDEAAIDDDGGLVAVEDPREDDVDDASAEDEVSREVR